MRIIHKSRIKTKSVFFKIRRYTIKEEVLGQTLKQGQSNEEEVKVNRLLEVYWQN